MKTPPMVPRRHSSRAALRLAAAATLLLLLAAPARPQAAEPTLPGDHIPTQDGDLIVCPLYHATLALSWKTNVIYVDPVGDATRFANLPPATHILITDVHGDHFAVKSLHQVAKPSTHIVAPPAVAENLPPSFRSHATILATNQVATVAGLHIETIPAYNLTPDRKQYHVAGRGVGYVLTLGGTRVYLSGDTEDIPEMRSLKNIDVAFLCMNLPYTMTVEQAADATRAFKPRIVYPYHSRGSDLARFQSLVGTNSGTEVRVRNWYVP